VTVSRALWLVAEMSPKRTVEKIVTDRYRASVRERSAWLNAPESCPEHRGDSHVNIRGGRWRRVGLSESPRRMKGCSGTIEGLMAGKATSTIWRVDVDRLIYTTITLMSVLIIYDGWSRVSFAALVRVIVGPVVAMFLSHVFATYLAHEVARGRGRRCVSGWRSSGPSHGSSS
jgi:hypothetical protein